MAEKEFYAAIDLGTTNSVIAYGNMAHGRMRPIVLELDRKNDTGSTSRSPLLPSVVFYYKNNEGKMAADVGDYAKSRYGTRAGYVCKSVKSMMGVTNQVPLVDEIPDRTPADVSGQILSYMVNSAKKRLFQQELRDVIITVPASFDSDQCQATIDAARRAGLNVENTHEVLLYEPKAVIYDFMRMQEDGEIPQDLLSLDTGKNVMVFDLGGGTLDVTLHRVGYTEEGILNIRDLAISRYTLIGGDNFDELIAADMLKRFEKMYDIRVSVRRREEVLCRLRKLAEQLKMEFSLAYENAKLSDIELPDDYEVEVMDISLYDAYAYEDAYTKAEMEQILAPLMGYQYKKDDVSRIQRMDERDVDNIIYPVLDVLDKAGGEVQIDAVLLNGGMTKFYLIRERLKEFFGFEPLETSDPDLAVARGAVYYHYCLHKYHVRKMEAEADGVQKSRAEQERQVFHTGTILNDSINLGLRGEYVSLLIPAGTELPYRSEEIRGQYRLEMATDTIGIELFLGRGKTKNLPNRRIATRVVRFANSYPVNTPISFQIYINSLRMMTMEAWITDKPKTKVTMEMDMASLKVTEKSSKGIGTVGKLRLSPKSELNELKMLADRNRSLLGHELNEQITRRLEQISQASNPQDFFEPCMDIIQGCKQSDPMLGYVYTIGVCFRDGWTESQKRQMRGIAKQHFTSYAESIPQSSYIRRKALELIAVTGSDFAAFCTEYLNRVHAEQPFRQVILQFVARYEADDPQVIQFYKSFFRPSDMNRWIAAALIQRKEKSQQSGQPDPLTDDYRMKRIWQALKQYLAEEPNTQLGAALAAVWEGKMVTPEERRMVDALLP